jgi:hypothetical protein
LTSTLARAVGGPDHGKHFVVQLLLGHPAGALGLNEQLARATSTTLSSREWST